MSRYWKDLEQRIEKGDEALKELLIDLGLYDTKLNQLKLIDDGNNNAGGIIGDEKVLIARKQTSQQEYEDKIALKQKLKKAYDEGVNVAQILDVIYDKESKLMLQVQERATGSALGRYGATTAEDVINLDVLSATDDQIKKLISDLLKLQELGVGTDLNLSNILFDKENGFQLIDLDQKTGGFGKEKFTVDEYVDDLFGGTFDAAIAHFEDIGDQTSIGLFEQLKKRFSSIGETIAHNIDNSVDGHSTQFQNSGEQIADDIINGYETRIKDLEIQLRSEEDYGYDQWQRAESLKQELSNSVPISDYEQVVDNLTEAKEIQRSLNKELDDAKKDVNYFSNALGKLDELNSKLKTNFYTETDYYFAEGQGYDQQEILRLSKILDDESALKSFGFSDGEIADIYGNMSGVADKIAYSLKEFSNAWEYDDNDKKYFYDDLVHGHFIELSELIDTIINRHKQKLNRSDFVDQQSIEYNKFADSNFNKQSQKETANLKPLETQVDNVTDAVDRKTRAFKEEEQVVIGVAQREANELEVLLGTISLIEKELRSLDSIKIGLEVKTNKDDEIISDKAIESLQKLKTLVSHDEGWTQNLYNVSNSVKNLSVDKKTSSHLIDLTIALSEFVQEVNKIDINKTGFLSDINALLDKGEQLQKLANILQTTDKKIKSVSRVTNVKPKKVKNKKSSSDDNLINYTQEAKNSIAQLRSEFSKLVDNDNFKKVVDPLEAVANGVKTKEDFDNLTQSIRIAKKELNGFQKLQRDGWQNTEFKNISDALDHYTKSFDATIKSSIKDSNGAIKEFTAEYRDAENQLVRVRVAANGAENAVQQLVKVTPNISAWEKFGGVVGGVFTYARNYLMHYFSLQEVIQAVRYGVRSIVELDTAMTELRKVSKDSSYAIDNYFSVATESAKELGATVGDLLNATADWSRMGYNLADAKELAEISTLYMHVGDGIDIDQASSSLVSTMKGFHMEAEDAMGIIDKFNEVANTNPIESGGIGEALQRSAASFYMANTDLSSAIALITASNSVVQDPEKVGKHFAHLCSNT